MAVWSVKCEIWNVKEDQVEEFKIVMNTRKIESDKERTNGKNHFVLLLCYLLISNFPSDFVSS